MSFMNVNVDPGKKVLAKARLSGYTAIWIARNPQRFGSSGGTRRTVSRSTATVPGGLLDGFRT